MLPYRPFLVPNSFLCQFPCWSILCLSSSIAGLVLGLELYLLSSSAPEDGGCVAWFYESSQCHSKVYSLKGPPSGFSPTLSPRPPPLWVGPPYLLTIFFLDRCDHRRWLIKPWFRPSALPPSRFTFTAFRRRVPRIVWWSVFAKNNPVERWTRCL